MTDDAPMSPDEWVPRPAKDQLPEREREMREWIERNTLSDVQMFAWRGDVLVPVDRIVTFVRGDHHATWQSMDPDNLAGYWEIEDPT